jgi:hypothetical protein
VYGRLGRGGKTLAVAARDVRGQRAVLWFRGARGRGLPTRRLGTSARTRADGRKLR